MADHGKEQNGCETQSGRIAPRAWQPPAPRPTAAAPLPHSTLSGRSKPVHHLGKLGGAQTANGFVHLPDAAPWLAPYLDELAVFPHGKHDDQVDSTAQLLDWFKRGAGPSSDAGIFEPYRQRAEETRGKRAAPERRVRLRVPPGIGHRNMLLLNVAADGTVEMPEAEAESFLRAGWVRVDAGDLTGTRTAV